MIRAMFCAFILFAVAFPAYAGEFEEGKVAFEFQDYETALQKWRPLAESGHSEAQASIGNMYFQGKGLAKNTSEALRWWKKAAENGDSNLQNELGHDYYFGDKSKGISRDFATAVKWFQKANVKVALGSMFLEGLGVGKNVEEGKRLIEEGAKENSFIKKGMECLATNVIEGTAPYLILRDVAERGNVDAQGILGSLYARSVCSEEQKAKTLAFHWLTIAGDNGNKESSAKLNDIRQSMRPDEISEAEKRIGNTKNMISNYTDKGEHPCVILKSYLDGLNHDVIVAENAYFKKSLTYPNDISSLGITVSSNVSVSLNAKEQYNLSEISIVVSSPNCSSNGVTQEHSIGVSFNDNALEIEKLNDSINSGKLAGQGLSEKLYQRGLLLNYISKPDQALADFNKAIELTPDDSAGVYYSRAIILNRLKRPDQALADFDKAIALRPTDGKSHYYKAKILKEKKQYDAAIDNLNKVVDLVSMDCRCVFNELDHIFTQPGDEKRAIENAQGIVARNPGDIPALDYLKGLYEKQENSEKVLELFGKIMELDKNKEARFQERGEYYYKIKQKEKAIRDFSEAAKHGAWVDWGTLIVDRYFEANQPEDALQDLNMAIDINPDNWRLYTIRSDVNYLLGKTSVALNDISKAIDLIPWARDYILRDSLTVYALAGEMEKAISGYEKLTRQELKTNYNWVFYNYRLSALYDLNGDNNRKESALKERLDQINEIYPKDAKKGADYYRWMARHYECRNDYNSVGAIIDELMTSNHDLDEYEYIIRGESRFRKSNFQLAIDDLSKSIEIYPQYWNAYKLRGMCYLALGQFDKAEKEFMVFWQNSIKYTDISPNDFSSFYPFSHSSYAKLLLYIAQARMGKNAEAELRTRVNKLDSVYWPAPIVSMFLGELKPEDVISAAKDRNPKIAKAKMFDAYFYSGQYYLTKNETAKAIMMFQKAIDIGDKLMLAQETPIAIAELKRI
ncbi:MAG: tetratricopeptide repeat protein, partial [Nitrospinae bacterium]|nr:tetratricopeptide repeat protein [Nitrospinota bacterium]